jgi:tellurite resistance protein
MHDQDMAIVKALVPVAWADGVFAEREKEMIEALLDAYGADDQQKIALRTYAASKRTLDDVSVQDLSSDDRRVVLQHAVLLTYADGDQSKEEAEFLERLARALRVPSEEAQHIFAAAAERAKKLLGLLG